VQNKDNIDVAVVLIGNEGYGIRRFLIDQYNAAKDHNISFHYICLHRGELYEKLSNLGADIKIIGGKIPKPYPPNLLKVFSVFLSSLVSNCKSFKKICNYINSTKPSLVYTHDPTLNSVGGLAARRCGIKSIRHFHGQLNIKRNWGLSRILLSCWLNLCTDMGLAISQTVRDSLWGSLKKKTYCVYNGLDIPEVKQQGEQLAGVNNCEAADIVCVGRLVNIKKQHILIESLGILAKQGLSYSLIFVGGPAEDTNPYYHKLKKKAETLGISDNIKFVGQVQNPFGIITKSRVSVLCCDREGFGYVIPESMACGTPVIVVDAAGPSELVEHDKTGLKFKPDNATELAECLRILLSDEAKAKELSREAYSQISQNLSMKTHLRQIKEKFCEVLDKS